MNKQQILSQIKYCFDNGQISLLENLINTLVETVGLEQGSIDYAQLLLDKFTHFKADTVAKLMEIGIRSNMGLGVATFPKNPLFQICIITGSKDLYDCYVEECIDVLLKNAKDEEKRFELFVQMSSEAERIHEEMFENYQQAIKGIHYNGGFKGEQAGLLSIHESDFNVMNDLCENYNSIIGRRDLLKEIEKELG